MGLFDTVDTTALSYWLNWRVLLCAIWVFLSMVFGSYVIRKYENLGHFKSYHEETWNTCVEEIHPIWLLTFRITAFCLLLGFLIVETALYGWVMFYYYTQWTFTLVAIYFGFGSVLSIYGCYCYQKSWASNNCHHVAIDAERGSYVPLQYDDNATISRLGKRSCSQEENHLHEKARICSYIFQVMYQICAGSVMLTDCIYWFIIYPFLTLRDYNMNFLTIVMHSLNAFLLVGDTALNRLRFPWFRCSYFVLWTGAFIIFQWIIHACNSIWWPYPFMDLSSSYAPLWYVMVGLIHLPCYGIFVLIVRLKHYMLSTYFAQSYQERMR